MNGQHTTQISNDMFYVWSDAADYEYIIRVLYTEDLYRAMEIAEREATKWGAVSELEGTDEYDHYYNSGYVEIVKEALDEESIEATYFTNCYE